MQISLQDVGDYLGLSRSSVSRGLRGDPRIPPATRKRIRDACEKLGYRPNSIITELAANHWDSSKVSAGSSIAYIVRSGRDETFGPSVPELADSMRRHAASLGYQLDVLYRSDFISSSKLQKTLRNRGITDVILGPIYEKELIVELDWSKFKCIQFGQGFFPLPLHGVAKDHFNSVVLAWQKAGDYGYRRIGITLLDHPIPLMDDILRMSAVHACQTQLFPDLPIIPPFLYPASHWSEAEFRKWLDFHRPDVVLGFNETHFHYLPPDRGIAYASLNMKQNPLDLSGILETDEVYGIELINLIHFCRRTHQWGIPKQRIDHIVEPTWSDGFSMPRKPTTTPPIKT
jgi:LacI family transcriptional regulator, galactose operon repressor